MTPGSNRVTISWTQVQRVRARISHRLGQAARRRHPQSVRRLDQRRGVPGLPALAERADRTVSPRPGSGRGPGRDRDRGSHLGERGVRRVPEHPQSSSITAPPATLPWASSAPRWVSSGTRSSPGTSSSWAGAQPQGRCQELSTHTPGLAGQDELCGSKSRAGSILIFRHARPMRWAARSPTPWPGSSPRRVASRGQPGPHQPDPQQARPQRARPRRMHTPTDGLYHGLESCLGLVQPKVQGLTGPGWWRLSPACYR